MLKSFDLLAMPYPFLRFANQHKNSMENATFNWQTEEGQTIFGKHWKVDGPRAVICLVHGLGEHIGRYDHMAAYYGNQNISMLGIDLPGHGQSAGKRGYFTSLDLVLNQLDQLLQKAQTEYPSTPILFLWA